MLRDRRQKYKVISPCSYFSLCIYYFISYNIRNCSPRYAALYQNYSTNTLNVGKSLNVVRFFLFQLMVDTGQTDGRSDRRTDRQDVMHNAASCGPYNNARHASRVTLFVVLYSIYRIHRTIFTFSLTFFWYNMMKNYKFEMDLRVLMHWNSTTVSSTKCRKATKLQCD